MSNQRFSGTDQYVATDDLMMAVNAAIRLRDSQLGDARVHDIGVRHRPIIRKIPHAGSALRRRASRASSWLNGCFR
jgi:hypothetical protein